MNNATAANEAGIKASDWDAAWAAFGQAKRSGDETGVTLAARRMRRLHLEAGVARERVPEWIRTAAQVG